MTTAFVAQQDFRFRNDDGSETAATWKATQGTNVSLETGTANRFRVRIIIEETNSKNSNTTFDLTYSLNGGAYTDITETSSVVQAISSANDGWTITDNDPTTEQLTYTGTFVAGRYDDNGATETNVQISGEYTEMEYCLYIVDADVSDADTIDFRAYAGGAALDAYNATPRVTVSKAVGYTLTAENGSYTLTGQDAGLLATRSLAAAQGSHTFTGQDATLTYTPTGYTLTAESGTYSLTGQDARLILSDSPVKDGLVLALDADAIEGLSDSDPVATWEDLSGAGNDATQGTALAQPTYQTGILDGKPVVRFDGTDDYLAISDSAVWDLDYITILAVFSLDDASYVDGNVLINRAGAGEWISFYWWSDGWRMLVDPTQAVYLQALASPPTQQAFIGEGDFDGRYIRLWFDGDLQDTHDFGSDGTITKVTSDMFIGSLDGTERFLDGDVAEILVYDRALTTTEREDVEQYLGEKWLGWSEGYTLTADQGTYSLTGQAAGTLASRLLTADQGAYTLTGRDASLVVSFLLEAAHGTYTLAGQDATLSYTPLGGYTLVADAGSYSLTGQDTQLLASRLLTAEQGVYTVTGQDAEVLRRFALEAAQGSYTTSGQDVGFVLSRVLEAETGTYSLDGKDVTFVYSGIVTPDSRIFVVAAEDRIYVIAAESRIHTVPSEDRIYAIEE